MSSRFGTLADRTGASDFADARSIGVTSRRGAARRGGGHAASRREQLRRRRVYRAFSTGVASGEPPTLLDDPTCFPARPTLLDGRHRQLRHPDPDPGSGGHVSRWGSRAVPAVPGRRPSVTSVFNIIPVPEPTTAVNFRLGLVGSQSPAARRPVAPLRPERSLSQSLGRPCCSPAGDDARRAAERSRWRTTDR